MARQELFALKNLTLLDNGIIDEAFKREIQHVVKDCEDRPLDKKARTVCIKFELVPVPDTSSNQVLCEHVVVACDISSSVPKRRTKVYQMKPKQDGSLVFHPDLPDDADGETLYDHDTGEVLNQKSA